MAAPATKTNKSRTTSSKGGTAGGTASKRKRRHLAVNEVRIYITATFNNTRITVTNQKGDVLAHGSAGKSFSGPRKSTPYAARMVVSEVLAHAAEKFGIKKVSVIVEGPGPGRDSAVRAIIDTEGLEVQALRDATRIPFNGCRPKKRRRA